MWAIEALMGIRRELDDQHGTVNLKQLLHEMERRPEVLTRREFLDSRGDALATDFKARKRANREFDSHGIVIAGPRHAPDAYMDHLDPAFIRSDRSALEEGTKPAFLYAQQMVAHRAPIDLDLGFKEVDEALDAIVAMLGKYTYLLLGYRPTTKFRLPKGWSRAFGIAWAPRTRR